MSDVPNLRRFRIIDLGALTLLAAICFAATAPWFRGASAEQVARMKLLTALSLPALMAGIVWAIERRRRVLSNAGAPIAQLHHGTTRWKYWPTVRACGTAACLTGFVALLFALCAIRRPTLLMLGQFTACCFFLGGSVCRFVWRIRPGDIEFFQHGFVLHGGMLFPWRNVEFQNSKFFADQLVLLAGWEQNGPRLTLNFPVEPECRTQILAAAAAAGATTPHASSNMPIPIVIQSHANTRGK